MELRTDHEHPIDGARLQAALRGAALEEWPGVEFDRPDLLDLWLVSMLPAPAILTSEQGPIDEGLLGPAARLGVPALVSDTGFAYRKKRPIPDTAEFEVGVRAHGPDAARLAGQYVELLRRWNVHRDEQCGAGPRLDVFPASTARADLPAGTVVDKIHTRVVISWP